MIKQKILIYGGSFDPVHNGHIALLANAKREIKPNITFVVPSKIPPLKNTKTNISQVKDRISMCKILCKKVGGAKILKYEIDSKSKSPSYTYKTIKYIKSKFKNSKIYLLIGADRYIDFKKWKNYQYILNNTQLVVGNRDNIDNIPEKAIIFLKFKKVHTSSQELQKYPNKKYLPKEIMQYISNNGLYIEQQIKPLMSIKRFEHTLRVKDTAIEIAKSLNYKKLKEVYIAAMYHDVCKEFTDSELIKYAKKYNKNHFPTIHTLHGLSAANYIKDKFNITNKLILEAIKNHVIPPKKCSKLSKILYCADKLEPNRTKEDVSNRIKYLKLTKTNINQCFLLLYNEMKRKY